MREQLALFLLGRVCSFRSRSPMGLISKVLMFFLLLSFVSWSINTVMIGAGKQMNKDIDYDDLPFQWVLGTNNNKEKEARAKKKKKRKQTTANDETNDTEETNETDIQQAGKDDDDDEHAHRKKDEKDPRLTAQAIYEDIPLWVRKLALGKNAERFPKPKKRSE